MQRIGAIWPDSRDSSNLSVAVLQELCSFSLQFYSFQKDEGSIPVRLLDLIISITARLAKGFNKQSKFPSFNSENVEVVVNKC